MIDSGFSCSIPKQVDSSPEGDRWPHIVVATPLCEGSFLDSLESAAAAATSAGAGLKTSAEIRQVEIEGTF